MSDEPLRIVHLKHTLMKRTLLNAMVLIIVLLAVPMLSMASGFGPDCGPTPGVPLDGGLSLLAIAGVSYSAKKILGKKNNK